MDTAYWKDKVVLVTGGASGIGLMIAETFADAGAKLAICALEQEAVEATAARFEKNGVECLGMAVDITKQEQVDQMFERVIERFGRLDVLVNNAGRTARGKILDTTPEQFASMLELNFLATVRCTLAAMPHLKKQRGHIVNIGSLAAKTGSRWTAAYPASKFAVAAYSQQLRLELADEGVHVLLVCPGPVKRDTPRLYPLDGIEDLPEDARKPGAGAKIKGVDPDRLARNILLACERRRPEIVMPWKSRILFAIAQLFPRLGDWILLKMTA